MSFNDFVLFFSEYGYLFIFVSAFWESIIFLALFLPGSLVVLFGGYIAGLGHTNVWFVFLFAFLGVFLGDVATYFLGRSHWEKLLGKSRLYGYLRDKEKLAHKYFERFGSLIIIYSHLLYLRSLICFFAGSAKMSFKRYIYIVSVSSLLWSFVFVFTGYFFGRTGQDIKDANAKIVFFVLGIGVLVLVFHVVSSRLEAYMKEKVSS